MSVFLLLMKPLAGRVAVAWSLALGLLVFLAWQFNWAAPNAYDHSDRNVIKGLSVDTYTFDRYSHDLVVNSTAWRHQGLIKTSFMSYGDRTYYSQFGLAEDVYAAVCKLVHYDFPRAQAITAALWRLLGAAVVAAFVWALAANFGLIAAISTAIFMALADFAVLSAGHLYWVFATLLLPFVVPWVIFTRWGFHARTIRAVAAAHVGTLMLRCLFGYEFLTTLAMAPLPAVFYFGWVNGERRWTAYFRVSLLIGLASLVGFAAALGLQILKGAVADGTLPSKMLAVVQERLVHRSSQGMDNSVTPAEQHHDLLRHSSAYRQLDKLHLASPRTAMLFLWVYQAWRFLNSHAFSLPGGYGVEVWLVLLWALVSAGLASLQRHRWPPEQWQMFAGLLWAWGGSAVACLSWYVLAFNHFIVHMWQCPIVMYLGFMPLTALIFVKAASMFSSHLSAKEGVAAAKPPQRA